MDLDFDPDPVAETLATAVFTLDGFQIVQSLGTVGWIMVCLFLITYGFITSLLTMFGGDITFFTGPCEGAALRRSS